MGASPAPDPEEGGFIRATRLHGNCAAHHRGERESYEESRFFYRRCGMPLKYFAPDSVEPLVSADKVEDQDKPAKSPFSHEYNFRRSLSAPLDVPKPQVESDTSMMSSLNVAGLKVLDKDHAGIIKDYVSGMFNEALDAATKPMEGLLGTIAAVTSGFSSKTSTSRLAGNCLSLNFDDCLHTRVEWQVVQGQNENGDVYTTYRHRKYGTVLELYHSSWGCFTFQATDNSVVRRCVAVTEFAIENRDYWFHPELLNILRCSSDNDEHSLLKYAVVRSGTWTATSLQGKAIRIEQRSPYDKNNETLVLVPDGFVFICRGNIINLQAYRKREAIILRKGTVTADDAKAFLRSFVGEVPGLTNFEAPNATYPPAYEYLLEDGKRLQGHESSLEERWLWRGREYTVQWTPRYKSYKVLLDGKEEGANGAD
ncbi:hypothetical protein GUITHDRAFT_103011 [Guillardia theta CCMP2712]|uniref:Uncharacterized protein n=1 Tax=Guillardia theta (strain CCMP2712) TaxID=905079 RepID=L1JR96_GUITC|nr:hypothetical protein GUITHDRAFT_103011 [Guillardia theta CCMP2712]EKX51091.1 hypothetical protein GUITHDRAFT_103011 [Guillardia theta CCMP2712]|eukprot:XP_005838071.1 hypothetical protein GUITHDRAFT_103011 [Guillardia theta CCMP2712]